MIFFTFKEKNISFKQRYERTVCDDILDFSIYRINKKNLFLNTTVDSSNHKIKVVY